MSNEKIYITSASRGLNVFDARSKARMLRQKVQVVEKLLELMETIKFEKLENVYGIPSGWLVPFLQAYADHDINLTIHFTIPFEVVNKLKFESDGRVIWRHVARELRASYKKRLDGR